MKYCSRIFTVLVLAVLAGCGRKEQPSVQAICWQPSLGSMQTKAYPDDPTVYSTYNSFLAFGLKYTGTWGSASFTPYIPGSQVRYFATSSTWSTLSEYFWPTDPGARLHFASCSPFVTLSGGKAYYTSAADGLSISNYTVPADKAHQISTTDPDSRVFYNDDLCVSNESDYLCSDMQASSPGITYGFDGIPTLFKHIMTRLRFDFVDITPALGYGQTITVLEVCLKNVYTTGDFHTLTSGSPTYTWTNHSNQKTCVLYDNHRGTDLTSTPVTLIENYLAMPQTITAGVQRLEVTYRITSSVGGFIFIETSTAGADLVTAGQDWLYNKDITYTISLQGASGEKIYFTASCEEWQDGHTFDLTPED